MGRNKEKGRSSGNRSTHYGVYEDRLLKSVREAQHDCEQMKNKAQWPMSSVFHMAECIQLVAPEKKRMAVKITLIECRISILNTSTEVG